MGTIAVENGKITEVRAGGETPRDVPVLDIGGRVVLPGWVSARAFPNDYMGDLKWHVQNNENIEPILPEMDARFAFDLVVPLLPRSSAGSGLPPRTSPPGIST